VPRTTLFWTLVLGYLLFLYATLPVMPEIWHWLDAILGGSGVWAIYAATSALLLILLFSVLARGARSMRIYLAFALLCGLLLGLGTLEENPGEKIHMLQYAILGILLYCALGSHKSPLGRGIRLNVYGALCCISAGALDEIIQYFLPGRTFTWHDVLVNGASGVLTIAILAFCLSQARSASEGKAAAKRGSRTDPEVGMATQPSTDCKW
jgi:hypothetical protein